MWVKICGNTRLEDCLVAADAGADAVGFVFAPGKRTVTARHVAAITSRLPQFLEKFGVFTTMDVNDIAAAATAAHLTGVQLHRSYDSQFVERLRIRLAEQPVRIMQVLHWKVDEATEQQVETLARQLQNVQQDGIVNAILLDSCTATGSGGTGKSFDWESARPLFQGLTLPLIVAGGLTSANAAAAITALCPHGLDVSSGVESAPGQKDEGKLRSFLVAAKA